MVTHRDADYGVQEAGRFKKGSFGSVRDELRQI